jgi:hypothetical protein
MVADANRGKFPPLPIVKVIVPASIAKGHEWRYTTEKPAAGWMKPDFDDKAWLLGVAGFGEPSTPGSKVRTKWKTGDIWIRRTFELKDTDLTHPHFRIHHDEDAQIYVNGVLAAKVTKYTSEYMEIPLNKEGRAALKKGVNTLAAHCHQEMGGQYIDVGLVDVIPRPKKN